ncbi:transcription factor adf-1 [Plakobranchus ocellatus]|uniref:Transcription factor adf-1 n=1 Tax=Plakobranchus ocellatus TaxID=259542 RepID=A0AAV3XUT0_9GAST|nr:transcription factor adf-1 [Plakobranchus ocellatus]
MLFLKDIVAPRRCQSSLDSIVSDVDSQSHNQFTVPEPAPESNNEHYDIPTSSSAASPSECQPGLSPTPQARGKKRKSTASPGVLYQQKLLDLEEKKLELLTQRNEKNDKSDDDLLFLKSLLPYIKRIPAERKLSFRSGIQRVVEDFAFGGQHASDFRISNTEMYQQQTPLPIARRVAGTSVYLNQTMTMNPTGPLSCPSTVGKVTLPQSHITDVFTKKKTTKKLIGIAVAW